MNAAVRMVECLNRAVKDVLDTLGTQGQMLPANVPRAAKLLSEHAREFEALEAPSQKAADEIAQLAAEMR